MDFRKPHCIKVRGYLHVVYLGLSSWVYRWSRWDWGCCWCFDDNGSRDSGSGVDGDLSRRVIIHRSRMDCIYEDGVNYVVVLPLYSVAHSTLKLNLYIECPTSIGALASTTVDLKHQDLACCCGLHYCTPEYIAHVKYMARINFIIICIAWI